MAKAKKQKIEIADGVLTVEYPTIRKSVEFTLPKAGSKLGGELLEHGAKQRVGDLESGGSPQEKYEAALKLRDAWADGKWEIARTPTDNSALVIEAVCMLKDLDIEDVTAELEEKSEEDRAAKIAEWKSNEKVKAKMARILADRAEAAIEDDSTDDIEV